MPRRVMTLHPNGQWCRRIDGRLRYFGRDYQEAVRRLAGMESSPPTRGSTVGSLAARWMEWQRSRAITPGTLDWYRMCSEKAVRWLGADKEVSSIKPEDVERLVSSCRLSPTGARNVLRVVRGMVSWGDDVGACVPPRGMRSWKGPTEAQVRSTRRGREMLWSAEECRAMIGGGGERGRLLCLLGINLGHGPADVAEQAHQDVEHGEWVTGRRRKTGIPRLGWLWPETRDLIGRGIRVGLSSGSGIAVLFDRHCARVGVERRGRGMYSLRRTMRTVADESGDVTACRLLMGHAEPGMERFYVLDVSRDRVRRACEHVRRWVLGPHQDDWYSKSQ